MNDRPGLVISASTSRAGDPEISHDPGQVQVCLYVYKCVLKCCIAYSYPGEVLVDS